ncbi:PREDICTED: transmembrane protein 17B-like [Haliaeetus leucocephalus]|uniref:transmembrane protein 17B-like n=1 Tax=Haliaeetus leucocephalus TaxID=52644 RepID=UPI00053CE726|nr:PREDICTED: transmembrane protein 17B-like [Haliaeetus leucocephalus]
MAVHTPLPPNLRWGLAVFSSSLFINNKTWDSGAAHTYHAAHEVLASLPLQMMLYFNVYYFPVWCLAEGMMLQLKYHLLQWHYQFLLVAAFLILSLAEGSRLYLGYVGNLQEKVPELAGFLLLSFLIQLPLLLFLLTDSHVIRLPLEMAVHSLFLAFLVAEIVAAFLALKTMTKQLAAQFYLRQFKEGSRGRLGQGETAGQAAEEG